MGMGGWGMPGVGMGMGYERPVEETVVNNYYDDSPAGGRGSERESRGNDSQLADDSWSDSGSGSDDSGSFDGGGGSNDDSGGF